MIEATSASTTGLAGAVARVTTNTWLYTCRRLGRISRAPSSGASCRR